MHTPQDYAIYDTLVTYIPDLHSLQHNDKRLCIVKDILTIELEVIDTDDETLELVLRYFYKNSRSLACDPLIKTKIDKKARYVTNGYFANRVGCFIRFNHNEAQSIAQNEAAGDFIKTWLDNTLQQSGGFRKAGNYQYSSKTNR